MVYRESWEAGREFARFALYVRSSRSLVARAQSCVRPIMLRRLVAASMSPRRLYRRGFQPDLLRGCREESIGFGSALAETVDVVFRRRRECIAA